jgi:DNA polymerase-3 subunit epsilon
MATGRPESPLEGRVACVDLETTGGTAARHRIIEVGIVLLEDGLVVDSWSSLVNPGARIPPSIAEFTGIDDAMVSAAPTFADIAADVRRRLDGRLFVAHNARFDYGFLRNEFRRVGQRYSAPVLCTVRLSRMLCPGERRHNLDSLIERYGLACTARHRALGDAEVLPPLLHRLAADRHADEFVDACSRLLHEPRLPAQLAPELADDLPDAPGVYVLYDEYRAPLFVGRGNNVRSRVLAHFAGAARDNRDGRLAQLVRGIEWFETGGELGALLLERRLVREWRPIENRQPRRGSDAYAIHLDDTPAGLRTAIEPLRGDSFAGTREVYGPFRKQQDAVKALQGKSREAQLCLRLLGLESGEGSCVAHQLGSCRGACVGREPRALHDARVRLALASLRVRRWPFAGAVAVREPAPDGYGSVLHVLDRWRHVGTANSEGDLADLLRTRTTSEEEIDVDSYRVIGRCLERVAPRDLVTLTERDLAT